MQNIPRLEQVFNKGKEKNIAGIPYLVLWPQLTLVHCNEVINNNSYWLQLHLIATGSFTDNHFHEHLFLTEHINKRQTLIQIVIIVYN